MFSPPPRAQPWGLRGIRRLRGFASCVLAQRRVPPPVPGRPHLIAPEPRCRAADASPPPVSHPDTARAQWKDTKRSPRMTAEGHHAGYERTRSSAPRRSPRWLRRNSGTAPEPRFRGCSYRHAALRDRCASGVHRGEAAGDGDFLCCGDGCRWEQKHPSRPCGPPER